MLPSSTYAFCKAVIGSAKNCTGTANAPSARANVSLQQCGNAMLCNIRRCCCIQTPKQFGRANCNKEPSSVPVHNAQYTNMTSTQLRPIAQSASPRHPRRLCTTHTTPWQRRVTPRDSLPPRDIAEGRLVSPLATSVQPPAAPCSAWWDSAGRGISTGRVEYESRGKRGGGG